MCVCVCVCVFCCCVFVFFCCCVCVFFYLKWILVSGGWKKKTVFVFSDLQISVVDTIFVGSCHLGS